MSKKHRGNQNKPLNVEMQTIICKVDIEMVGENGKVEKK